MNYLSLNYLVDNINFLPQNELLPQANNLLVYILTDTNNDKYKLKISFQDFTFHKEIENEVYNYKNSSLKEIDSFSIKLKNIAIKSNGAMTFILKKANVLKANKCIDTFLQLDDNDKENFLEHSRKKIEDAINTTDLSRIVEINSGESLFHQLLRSKSPKVRLLALECISAGFPIDTKNKRGNTGLVIAISHKDQFLVRELLDKGADYNSPCGTGRTPIELAKLYDIHLVTLEFFLREIKNLKDTPDQIIDLWEKIYNFKQELHNSKEHENTDKASKTCDEQICGLIKSLISSVPSDYDFKSIFSGKRKKLQEEFIQFCAYEGFGEVLIKNFIRENLLSHLSKYLDIGMSRDFSEDKDLDLLKCLIESRLIFALTEKETNSNYVELLYKSPKIISIIEKLPDFNKKTILDCTFLVNCMSISILDFLKKHEEIKLKISQLKENDFALGILFSKLLKDDFDEINKHLDAIAHYNGNSLDFLNFINKNNLELPYLHDCCIYLENSELLSEIYNGKLFDGSIEKFQTRMFFHLFLDKLLISSKKSLEGFLPSCAAGGLIQAFNAMENYSSEHIFLANMVRSVKSEIMPLLQNVKELYTFEKKWQRIQEIKTDEKLYLSLIIEEGPHAMSLMVERNSEETFRLTLYNTGQRVVNWHPRWEKSSRYQTFLVIDQIPSNSIIEKNSWERLLKEKVKEDSVYDIFFNEIGDKGIKLSPSLHEEDYEAIQVSGTCCMQNLLAMIRHQTMQIVLGSLKNKEAQYEYLKMVLQAAWLKSHPLEYLQEVAPWISHVSEKLEIKKQLFDLAMDIDASNRALNQCSMLLGQETHDKDLEIFNNVKNINYLERYSLQRKAAMMLSHFLSGKSNEMKGSSLLEKNAIIDFAVKKLETHKQLETNFLESLDQFEANANFEDWIFIFIEFIVNANCVDFGIKEFVKRIQNQNNISKLIIFKEVNSNASEPHPVSPENALEALVCLLKPYPESIKASLIERLLEHLQLAHLNRLAETLKEM